LTCTVVIIVKSQAVLDSITKWEFQTGFQAQVRCWAECIHSGWEYFTTCN